MFKENPFYINKKIIFQNIYRYQFLIFFNYVYKDYTYKSYLKKNYTFIVIFIIKSTHNINELSIEQYLDFIHFIIKNIYL